MFNTRNSAMTKDCNKESMGFHTSKPKCHVKQSNMISEIAL
jgi:hypothetical protein